MADLCFFFVVRSNHICRLIITGTLLPYDCLSLRLRRATVFAQAALGYRSPRFARE